jgi:hypothetical protein
MLQAVSVSWVACHQYGAGWAAPWSRRALRVCGKGLTSTGNSRSVVSTPMGGSCILAVPGGDVPRRFTPPCPGVHTRHRLVGKHDDEKACTKMSRMRIPPLSSIHRTACPASAPGQRPSRHQPTHEGHGLIGVQIVLSCHHYLMMPRASGFVDTEAVLFDSQRPRVFVQRARDGERCSAAQSMEDWAGGARYESTKVRWYQRVARLTQ